MREKGAAATTCSTGWPPTSGCACPGRDRRAGGRPGPRSSARRRLRSARHDRVAIVASTPRPRYRRRRSSDHTRLTHPPARCCPPAPTADRNPAPDTPPPTTPCGVADRGRTAFVPDRAGRAARQDLRGHAGAHHPVPSAAGVARGGRGVRGAVRGGGGGRPPALAVAGPAGRVRRRRAVRAGAVILLAAPAGPTAEAAEHEYEAKIATKPGWRAALASFVVLFTAEWGDLSQLLTAGLVASGGPRCRCSSGRGWRWRSCRGWRSCSAAAPAQGRCRRPVRRRGVCAVLAA